MVPGLKSWILWRRGRDRPLAYARTQIVLHWLVVGLLLVQYSTSGAITRTHSIHMIGQRQNPTDLVLHIVHNRVGLALIAVMVGRLLFRFWAGVPEPGSATPDLSSRVAHWVHAAFYAVLITEGVTGAIASYFWWPISVAHVILFKILLGLIALHVVAVFWHQFVLGHATLHRIGVKRLFE